MVRRDMRNSYTRHLLRILIAATILLSAAGRCGASEPGGGGDLLVRWWEGKYLTGPWFGVRDDLAGRGVDFRGKYVGVFYGVVDSQRGSRGFYDQDLSLDAEIDAAKLMGSDGLKGLTAFGGVRWRDPRANSNPNTFVEGNPMFNPGRYQSGTQWRLTHFGVGYASGEIFGIKNFLSFKGGWLQPQKDFLVQPLALLFTNNAICSSKGLTYNMPWSSSLSSWGGVLTLKPADPLYARGGLYMAAPQLTASGNHGLAFAGYAPDPSRNGLMTMVETGWTPSIGPGKLPGKYAIGGYYFGVDALSFDGRTTSDGVYGFYFQADQMLFREPSPAGGGQEKSCVPAEKAPPEAKGAPDFKAPASPEPLSSQGLSMFNFLTFAPGDVNLITFYFQSGFVYQGLIPGRDRDQAMCAVAYGSYSTDRIHALQNTSIPNQANFTMVLESGYRIHINEWSYVQPYAQYEIRPNGTSSIANATVLGFMAGIMF